MNRWSLSDSCASFQNLLSTATTVLVYIYLWLLYFTHLLQSDAATLCDHQLQSPMTTKHDGTTYMYIQRTLCSSVVYDQWGQHNQDYYQSVFRSWFWHVMIYLCTPGRSIPWVVTATNHWPEHPSRFCINLKIQQELL